MKIMEIKKPIRCADMSLIKDMQDHRIVYYWTDSSDEVISPILVTLAQADEWRSEYLNRAYEGYQKRTSPIDRRRHHHKRDLHLRQANVEALFQSGRRATDRQVRVSKDLAAEKLQQLFELYESREDLDAKQRN